ncbi:MAG: hypothetical protein ACREEM_47235 [Blastocatellia bacterium]
MSKEFKIANWKIEVDWSGMSLAPVEERSEKPERKQRKVVPRRRKAVAATVNVQKTTEKGETKVWV